MGNPNGNRIAKVVFPFWITVDWWAKKGLKVNSVTWVAKEVTLAKYKNFYCCLASGKLSHFDKKETN